MPRKIEAYMDDVALSDVGPFFVQSVNEPGPDMEITYINRPVGPGQIVQTRRRKSLRVTLGITIHELWDLQARTEYKNALARWASGSLLRLSNHDGQQLRVICKGAPGLGEDRDFNSVLNLEFEANAVPYWEDVRPLENSGNGASGTVNLLCDCNVDRLPITAIFRPGGTCTSLTVSTPTQAITLSGFSTASPIVFGRDEDDRLTITTGETSLLRYRTPTSDDDLYITNDLSGVSWASNVSGRFDVSVRGRWL